VIEDDLERSSAPGSITYMRGRPAFRFPHILALANTSGAILESQGDVIESREIGVLPDEPKGFIICTSGSPSTPMVRARHAEKFRQFAPNVMDSIFETSTTIQNSTRGIADIFGSVNSLSNFNQFNAETPSSDFLVIGAPDVAAVMRLGDCLQGNFFNEAIASTAKLFLGTRPSRIVQSLESGHSHFLTDFLDALDRWRNKITASQYEDAKKQLLWQLEDEADFNAGDVRPSVQSLEWYLDFLSGYPRIRSASISFTPSGKLTASWRPQDGGKARLSLVFVEHDLVRWVMVDARGRNKPKTGAGDLMPSEVISDLSGYKCVEWMAA